MLLRFMINYKHSKNPLYAVLDLHNGGTKVGRFEHLSVKKTFNNLFLTKHP